MPRFPWRPSPFVVAVAVAGCGGLLWVPMLVGPLSGGRGALADGLQVTASGAAAVALLLSVRWGRPALGSGTAVLGAAAGVRCATDLAWSVASRVGDASPDWLDLGYVAATVGYALGALLTARRDPGARVGSTARVATDGLLLGAGVALAWWAEVWDPTVTRAHTVIALLLQVADAAFVVAALLAWVRSGPARRRATGLLAVLAVLLLSTDAAYSREMALARYAGGSILDLGWFGVSAGLACLALLPPSPRAGARGWASWAQPVVPPAMVMVAMGTLATGRGLGGVVLVGIWSVIALMVVRHVLLVAEHLDLTDQLHEAAATLRHRADHDDLTGVLARAAFVRRVEEAMAARRADGGTLAVLWVDLDAFKRINDLLGHQCGDAVLRLVAARLEEETSEGDVVGRIGGDEFVVLRPVADGALDDWADGVRRALGESFLIEGAFLRVTCSIGLVESDGQDETVRELLIDGDLALYQAKHAGRDRVERFTPVLRGEAVNRSALARVVRRNVAEDAVVVRYQPVIDLKTGRAVGAEALARLPHPFHGELLPRDFLPLVEAMGLLPELTAIVLRRACRLFAGNPRLGWVSVNLSSEDMADPRLTDLIGQELEISGLEPGRLVVEINEDVVPEPHVLRAAQRVSALGVGLALDDFGTGISSLGQVRNLPLDLVKLDRSVVVPGGDGPSRSDLLTPMVSLAHSLGFEVLAEGIEEDVQADRCRQAGVTYGQGYLWTPALSATALRAFDAAGCTTSGAWGGA